MLLCSLGLRSHLEGLLVVNVFGLPQHLHGVAHDVLTAHDENEAGVHRLHYREEEGAKVLPLRLVYGYLHTHIRTHIKRHTHTNSELSYEHRQHVLSSCWR